MEFRPAFEDIRHRGAENPSPDPLLHRLPVPPDGVVPMRVAKEAAGSILAPHRAANPFRPRFRIAVRTRGRNLGTTPPGIEGVVRPFDLGIFCHGCVNLSLECSFVQ